MSSWQKSSLGFSIQLLLRFEVPTPVGLPGGLALASETARFPPPSVTLPLCSGSSSEAFQKGGRKGAKKVMIVITDGESHDSPDLEKVIQQSEKDNVTRYAVAVSPIPPLLPLPIF